MGQPAALSANPAALTSGLERMYAYGHLSSLSTLVVETPVINGIRIAQGPPQ